MRRKKKGYMLVLLAVLFLITLSISLSPTNTMGAKEPSERFRGDNTQRGKWTTGNLGKAYVEGDFVSYMLRIDSASKVWGATEFSISFNFHQRSSKAIYVDGFDTSAGTGFQWSTKDFLPDGKSIPDPSWGTHIPTPDAGEPWTSGPKITNYMDAWPPGTGDGTPPGSYPAEKRYFTVYGIPWTGDHIILFFRAHLALDIIWSEGLEKDLPTELDGDEFETWTAAWRGASFATGSSRHFFLEYEGIGDKTIPIPIAQYPPTRIKGYKYVNDVRFNDWEITLTGELALNNLATIPYTPSPVYTGTSPWSQGYFEFTGLIAGSFKVQEEDRSGYAHEDIVASGDGTNVVSNIAEGWVTFDLAGGKTETVDFYNSISSTTSTSLSATTITLCESVTDTITISTAAADTLPDATGTWTLKVADNIGMTGAITIGSGSVSGSLPFTTSVTWKPPSAGTWWFQAFYSGNYGSSQSRPADEELVVQKAPTTTATLLSATTITLGNSVTDTITISTTATGTLPAATGTWALKVADNVAMTGATTIGSGSVSGSLPFTASVTWIPPAAGTYYFQAFYSGDSNYKDSKSTPALEELVVQKAPTSIVTDLSTSTITLGGSVTDTITISTSATGTLPAATGTWTLKVADNVGMSGAITIGSGSVSGSLPFSTSVTWTPPSAGTWYFQASYSGDSNYKDSQSKPADEKLVVEKPPEDPPSFDLGCSGVPDVIVACETETITVRVVNTGVPQSRIYYLTFTAVINGYDFMEFVGPHYTAHVKIYYNDGTTWQADVTGVLTYEKFSGFGIPGDYWMVTWRVPTTYPVGPYLEGNNGGLLKARAEITFQVKGIAKGPTWLAFFPRATEDHHTNGVPLGEISDAANIWESNGLWYPVHNSYDPYDVGIGTGHVFKNLTWAAVPTVYEYTRVLKFIYVWA